MSALRRIGSRSLRAAGRRVGVGHRGELDNMLKEWLQLGVFSDDIDMHEKGLVRVTVAKRSNRIIQRGPEIDHIGFVKHRARSEAEGFKLKLHRVGVRE